MQPAPGDKGAALRLRPRGVLCDPVGNLDEALAGRSGAGFGGPCVVVGVAQVTPRLSTSAAGLICLADLNDAIAPSCANLARPQSHRILHGTTINELRDARTLVIR